MKIWSKICMYIALFENDWRHFFGIQCELPKNTKRGKQLQVKPLLPPVHMYDNLNIRVCTTPST